MAGFISGAKETQRLADLGRMSSHLAHEIYHQLVPVHLHLQQLKSDLADVPQSAAVIEQLETSLAAVSATASDLWQFTARRDIHPQGLNVSDMVAEAWEAVVQRCSPETCCIEFDIPPTHQVRGDRAMLRRAILNLLQNAVECLPDGGRVLVTSVMRAGAWELEVADSHSTLNDGPLSWMSAWWAKDACGSRSRLAVVEHIAEQHEGEVFAVNCPDGGVAWTLALPLRQTATQQAPLPMRKAA